MSSPNISKVLAKAKEQYDNIMDQWLSSTEVGHQVTVFYAPTYETCDTCQFAGWGNSTINGGPKSPISGSCPACGGTCQKEIQVTDTLRARLYSSDPSGFSPSLLKKLGISMTYPDYQMLMIASTVDIDKVKNSVKAQFYSDLESTVGEKFYELASDIRPHGFGKDKFFFCFWKKI